MEISICKFVYCIVFTVCLFNCTEREQLKQRDTSVLSTNSAKSSTARLKQGRPNSHQVVTTSRQSKNKLSNAEDPKLRRLNSAELISSNSTALSTLLR